MPIPNLYGPWGEQVGLRGGTLFSPGLGIAPKPPGAEDFDWARAAQAAARIPQPASMPDVAPGGNQMLAPLHIDPQKASEALQRLALIKSIGAMLGSRPVTAGEAFHGHSGPVQVGDPAGWSAAEANITAPLQAEQAQLSHESALRELYNQYLGARSTDIQRLAQEKSAYEGQQGRISQAAEAKAGLEGQKEQAGLEKQKLANQGKEAVARTPRVTQKLIDPTLTDVTQRELEARAAKENSQAAAASAKTAGGGGKATPEDLTHMVPLAEELVKRLKTGKYDTTRAQFLAGAESNGMSALAKMIPGMGSVGSWPKDISVYSQPLEDTLIKKLTGRAVSQQQSKLWRDTMLPGVQFPNSTNVARAEFILRLLKQGNPEALKAHIESVIGGEAPTPPKRVEGTRKSVGGKNFIVKNGEWMVE